MATLHKEDKTYIQNILKDLIRKERLEKWVPQRFYVKMLDYCDSNFSLFMNWKKGISKQRIQKLQDYFLINIKKI